MPTASSAIPALPFRFSDMANAVRRLAETINAVLSAFGQWVSPAFLASNFSANGAMTWTVASSTTYSYALTGRTMTVAMTLSGTVGGTLNTQLLVAIPNGYVATQAMQSLVNVYSGGVWAVGPAAVAAGATQIVITNSPGGASNYASGVAQVQGQITFEVN